MKPQNSAKVLISLSTQKSLCLGPVRVALCLCADRGTCNSSPGPETDFYDDSEFRIFAEIRLHRPVLAVLYTWLAVPVVTISSASNAAAAFEAVLEQVRKRYGELPEISLQTDNGGEFGQEFVSLSLS